MSRPLPAALAAHLSTRSIYQDIPMYTVDQFVELAPPEAHAEDVMSNEHQLMLNRLSFELVERQRQVRSIAQMRPFEI